MGFLVFAYRKLELTLKIDADQFKELEASRQLCDAQNQMSIFENAHYDQPHLSTQDEAEYQKLKKLDQQYETQKATLESQISLESAELENVKKAEEDSAKKTAPTFGLSS